MKKRTVIIGSFVVSAANIIFPPWQIKFKDRILDKGYWWLTNPPEMTSSFGNVYGSEINITRLLLQLAVVALVAGGLYFAVGKD